jgi:glycosyltransferase involved in cell wall biosynthesis
MTRAITETFSFPIVFVDDAHTFGGAQNVLGWAIHTLLCHCPAQPIICVCTPATREAIQKITGEDKNLRFVDCPAALPLNIFSFPLRLWPFYKLLTPLVKQGTNVWWFNLAGIEFNLAPLLILRLWGLRPVAWLLNNEVLLFFNANGSPPRQLLCLIRDAVANRFIFGLYRRVITLSHATEISLKGRIRCNNPPRTGFLYPVTGVGREVLQAGIENASPAFIDLWMVGRVEFGHKNNLAGLEVLKHLLLKKKDASLTIVGDGPDLDSLLNATKESGLSSDVHFRNWESNPWKAVPQGAIVLIPSLWESFCLVAREAMLCGTRIVVSPIPVFFEWIPKELIARDFTTEASTEKVEEVIAMSRERLQALYAPVLDMLTEEAFVAKFQSISKEEFGKALWSPSSSSTWDGSSVY